MVARKLNRMIMEHPTLLRSGKGGAGGAAGHHRPLLVILDRNSDLLTPLQYTSTYRALIDDLLQHLSNRVECKVQPDSSCGKVVVKKDPFLRLTQVHPFPEAIESNGVEWEEVSTRTQEIRSKTGGGAATVVQHEPDASTNQLLSAVDSLPVLLEQKKQLEVHTSILEAVMNDEEFHEKRHQSKPRDSSPRQPNGLGPCWARFANIRRRGWLRICAT